MHQDLFLGVRTPILAVLLIDRSTSMRKFSKDIQEAYAVHVAELMNSSQADDITLAVISFCGRGGMKLEVPPMPVKKAPLMSELEFDGGTPLYGATLATLQRLLIAHPSIKVVLNVVTDGEDRGSHFAALFTLQDAIVPAALARDFKLSVIGFGVDGIAIARRMGFIPELSVNVAGTRQGLTETFKTITRTVTGRSDLN